MKFDFSKSGDLQNKFQYIYSRLDKLLQFARYNNELLQEYLKLTRMDTKLQKQVDDYFIDDETSPQTDSDNKQDQD